MTFSGLFKYSLLAALAVIVVIGGIFTVEELLIRREAHQQQQSSAAMRETMLRLWHYPPVEPAPDEIKKLLVLCAYTSPYTRDHIRTASDTYRFLHIWQEAVRYQGPEPLEALVEQCRINPELVDPTPPQILWRQDIIRQGYESG